MSFLKIKDPKKRDAIVQDFLKTKSNIYSQSQEQSIGDNIANRENLKHFKPLIDSQQQLSKDITGNQKRFLEEIARVAQPLPIRQAEFHPQAISSRDPSPHSRYGPVASKSFYKALEKEHDHDTTFGIYTQSDKHYIGNKEVKIDGDNFVIDDRQYPGTPGLWELIRSKNPTEYTPQDLQNYEKILRQTNAIWRDNNPSTRKPKSNRSEKYVNIIKPFYEKIKMTKGSGTVFLPENSTALVDRLELLMASHQAGNTGVINEIVSILDELLRQNHITREDYKRVVLGIK